MSDSVIQVSNLWKKYRLGVLGTGTLRHDFNRWLHRTLGKPDPYAIVGEKQKAESRKQKAGSEQNSQFQPSTFPISALPEASLRDDEMWALRDICFEVKQGEILGIIGRNGAGKSTLLKILSRVTSPTSGEVRVKGRIASLLEVGTGFHPELTGRENIFLNGAILGMTKVEIKSKLDEIVAFSEIEKFLDTPVKRYSSGMYVRLAFAVAAHLEPEILIVDEVLAVGDAAFQKKCFEKLDDVATKGRTVLFVSHSIPAVRRLCRQAILLRDGCLTTAGPTDEVVDFYLAQVQQSDAQVLRWQRAKAVAEQPHVRRVALCDPQGRDLTRITTATQVSVSVDYAIPTRCPGLQLGIALLNADGQEIFGSAPQDSGVPSPQDSGCYRARVQLPRDIFMPKKYAIRVALYVPNQGGIETVDAIRFSVVEDVSLANMSPGGRQGFICLPCVWRIDQEQAGPSAGATFALERP